MTTMIIETKQESVQGFVSEFQQAMEGLGEQYGIYDAMKQTGPVTPRELAGFTGLQTSAVKMWLITQANGGYIHYSLPADRYCLWCPIKWYR